MKVLIAGVLLVVAGIGAGTGIAYFELRKYSKRFGDEEFLTVEKTEEIRDGLPKVQIVNGSEFNFGEMERHGTRSHEFEIKNIGKAPLSLVKGETTCKCTMNKLIDGVLPPGESVKVELEWIAKEVGPDMVFMQTADIKTNDPSRKVIRLTIRGNIRTSVKVLPSPLVMSSILASRGAEGEVVIYSYRTDDLDFVRTKVDPKLKGLIEPVVEPLTSEELAEDELARSGKKLKIRLKPGLPLGALDQTVWLTTNLKDSPLVPVHFQGNVVSDISLYGRYFNRTSNRLRLGEIKSADGFRTELRLLVRGEHRMSTQFEVVSVDPAGVFDLKFRESKDLKTGTAVQHVLDIAVLKGAPAISRLGSSPGKLGQILIRTTHPQVKQITLGVAFEISE